MVELLTIAEVAHALRKRITMMLNFTALTSSWDFTHKPVIMLNGSINS